jgi:hypothetical protein
MAEVDVGIFAQKYNAPPIKDLHSAKTQQSMVKEE